jgi:hypothetical protein
MGVEGPPLFHMLSAGAAIVSTIALLHSLMFTRRNAKRLQMQEDLTPSLEFETLRREFDLHVQAQSQLAERQQEVLRRLAVPEATRNGSGELKAAITALQVQSLILHGTVENVRGELKPLSHNIDLILEHLVKQTEQGV